MAEAVKVADAGQTVSPGSPNEMAAAILDMANQMDKRKQFSTNAQSAFERHFTLTKMAEAYMSLYRDGPVEVPN